MRRTLLHRLRRLMLRLRPLVDDVDDGKEDSSLSRREEGVSVDWLVVVLLLLLLSLLGWSLNSVFSLTLGRPEGFLGVVSEDDVGDDIVLLGVVLLLSCHSLRRSLAHVPHELI